MGSTLCAREPTRRYGYTDRQLIVNRFPLAPPLQESQRGGHTGFPVFICYRSIRRSQSPPVAQMKTDRGPLGGRLHPRVQTDT